MDNQNLKFASELAGTDKQRWALGEEIRKFRLEIEISELEFAEKVGVELDIVEGWEDGTQRFYVHHFFAICTALGKDPGDLVGRFTKAVREAEREDGPLGFI